MNKESLKSQKSTKKKQDFVYFNDEWNEKEEKPKSES